MTRKEEIQFLEKVLEEFKKDERSNLISGFTIDSQCKQYDLVITIPHKVDK